jgi:hypothetical protein
MIVKLRQESAEYPDLTPGQHYVVIGIEADDFRLLNDQGHPYLYQRRGHGHLLAAGQPAPCLDRASYLTARRWLV